MDKTSDFKKDLQSYLEFWDKLTQESIREAEKTSPKIFSDPEMANTAWTSGFHAGKQSMLQSIAEHFDLTLPSMEKDTN